MEEFKVGDIVIRKSYGGDVYFKIMEIVKKQDGTNLYILKGTNYRLIADAQEEDLEKPPISKISKEEDETLKRVNTLIKKAVLQRRSQGTFQRINTPNVNSNVTFGRPGKVLHIDGDMEYLNICLKGYKQLGIEAYGRFVPEVRQPDVVLELLNEVRPDILVLTGHDAMLKGSQDYKNLDSYRNSRYFVEAVRRAREYEPSYDDLVIFAGACQSFYEALIEAGANFASSPNRVFIHAMDPVFVCEKIAFSSISKFLNPKEIVDSTITGIKGIGGLETRGKYREGLPKSPYA
ncbi:MULTISPECIES: sporulation peptidase YabG [Caloramator]|uniref:Spore coat assemly protein n=1 Tax=Caloramator proteoclasticus DSM 10124 TaxID=1121262 RepID=A0A1M4UPM2_9CLOT|nr:MULTISPECIES: sporulation peptidase YabG [Caloramator]SHE58615.1 spore coat assemly protein [Caloramator proteoclasticus DSM 10124]